MLGNYPEESVQHSKHGESLKSDACWISYRYDYTPWFHVFKLLSVKRKEAIVSQL
jgi:hypothetical protein